MTGGRELAIVPRHYIFGEFQEGELTDQRLSEILEQAKSLDLQGVTVRETLDLLDRIGRAWRDPEYPLRVEATKRLPELVGFSAEMVEKGFSELGRLLDRSQLQYKLRYELGRSAALDGWVWRQGYDGYLRAVPLGVVTHISPGNVFLGAVDSLVHGLLTKNVNLVKISRGDPLFPLLFAQSVQHFDPESRLSSAFAVLTFPGQREKLEDRLRSESDAIVIWGGEEAVRAWSQGMSGGTRVIPYGPRYSLALVTSEALELGGVEALDLKGLVEDVVSWETRACGSPQVLYWPEDQASLLPAAVELLRQGFEAAEERLPAPELDLDQSVELRREYELARFQMLKGQGDVWAGPNLAWSIQLRSWDLGWSNPLNRTLIIVLYPSLERLFDRLRPLKRQLQSVGLAASTKEFRDLGLKLTSLGAHRITQWGKMWSPKHGAPHDGTFQLTQLIRWATIESLPERFDAERRLNPEPPSKTRRLASLIDVARGRSPYYAEHLPDIELKGALDLTRLPRLDSETLRQNTPPSGNALLTGPLEGAYVFASGGSTGAPKFSFYSLEEWEEVTDIMAAIYQKAGVTKDDTVANLFMAGNLWTSFLAASEALEKVGCLKLPIAGNVDPESVISYLQMFPPTVLLGLPSLLVRLAEMLEERGQRLQARTVLYGGEALSREARLYLQRVFGASTVASAGYASVDAGPIGYQTLDLPIGHHHLLYDYQYLEFLDPESGEPVADGQVGEITITCLGRRLMPLIRYRTGDLGRWIDSRRWIFELKGRSGDRLRVGSADLYPADVARVLDGIEGVGHVFQLIISKQGAKDHLEIQVERTKAEIQADSAHIKAELLSALGEVREALENGWMADLEVILLDQGALQGMRRTGKIRLVVDKRQ